MLWAAVHCESLLSCQVEPTISGRRNPASEPLFCDRLHQIGLATPSKQTNFLWLVSWIGLCIVLGGAQTKRGGLQPYLPASRFFCATEAVDDRLSFLVNKMAGTPELAASAELGALTPFFKKPDTPLTFIGALSDLKCRAVGFAPQTPWFFKRPLPSKKKKVSAAKKNATKK